MSRYGIGEVEDDSNAVLSIRYFVRGCINRWESVRKVGVGSEHNSCIEHTADKSMCSLCHLVGFYSLEMSLYDGPTFSLE